MKQNKKKKNVVIRAVLLLVLVAVIITGCIFSHFGGFGTGPCADTEEFVKYAGQIEDIKIPEGTRIVALGEATHGNREFQQLKLDVFQETVKNAGVRAFALEGDFGGCEYVNRYIHGGDGTAEEAAAAIGFAIYRTNEMAELISWMREYNESAKEGEDLCFYGFDMQRYEYNYEYLIESAKEFGVDTTELEKLWNDGELSDAYDTEQREEIIARVKEALVSTGKEDVDKSIHFADILLQNISLGKVEDFATGGNALRDELMAENTLWILEQEEKRGNNCIFISGHNGHIEQFGNYGVDHKVMGNILADELKDGYFAIGTDFYKTECNLPKGSDGKRVTHTFYSYDPLAKAARKAGYDTCWLDFSEIPESSGLKTQVMEYCYMGSLGEYYSPIFMNLLPMSYRVWRSPAELYDGVIFVTEAHPTEIMPSNQ